MLENEQRDSAHVGPGRAYCRQCLEYVPCEDLDETGLCGSCRSGLPLSPEEAERRAEEYKAKVEEIKSRAREARERLAFSSSTSCGYCPLCGSSDVGLVVSQDFGGGTASCCLASIFLPIPVALGLLRRTPKQALKCRACGHEWTV